MHNNIVVNNMQIFGQFLFCESEYYFAQEILFSQIFLKFLCVEKFELMLCVASLVGIKSESTFCILMLI